MWECLPKKYLSFVQSWILILQYFISKKNNIEIIPSDSIFAGTHSIVNTSDYEWKPLENVVIVKVVHADQVKFEA